jgi:hypothetical protein
VPAALRVEQAASLCLPDSLEVDEVAITAWMVGRARGHLLGLLTRPGRAPYTPKDVDYCAQLRELPERYDADRLSANFTVTPPAARPA